MIEDVILRQRLWWHEVHGRDLVIVDVLLLELVPVFWLSGLARLLQPINDLPRKLY